ncbi:probable Neutral protease 2 homolog SNOG_10522 [Phialocephala subalpina]|uniref:Neutral protease 2 n=1 Tax=Phialocephala subalpina TaxID=576137 RepID=A0A1L7XAS1_9HELO|nr:probable Neutral protease 2 homolog SNOG_10522 [Phialocephala subalpina]
MHFLRISLGLAALSAFGNAAVIENSKRALGLEVTLAPTENAAEVIATIKNVGAQDLNLLKAGTFLDSAPVQKLSVVDEANAPVAFSGIFRSMQYSALAPDYFHFLAAGAEYTTTIEAAAVHDFVQSGTYSFAAEGAMPFAIGNSTELSGEAVAFKSNTLTMAVDGAAAALVPKAIGMSLNERTVLQSGCSSSQSSSTRTALTNCASLARAASSAASSGSASKFSEYFKTTAASTRSTVAARLTAVANQCASTTSGATKYYCTDVYGYCDTNVLAYTIPSTNEIVNCPIYYTDLPALTSSCHAQDRATTTLHEMTHAPGTYSPGTADNAYGYSASVALSSARAVLNADSYALYANAIYAGC